MKNNMQYQKPEIEFILLNQEDVIRTSGDEPGVPWNPSWSEIMGKF